MCMSKIICHIIISPTLFPIRKVQVQNSEYNFTKRDKKKKEKFFNVVLHLISSMFTYTKHCQLWIALTCISYNKMLLHGVLSHENITRTNL